MHKLRIIAGTHQVNGVNLKPGDEFEADEDLASRWPEKFEHVGAEDTKKPKGLERYSSEELQDEIRRRDALRV